jgi:peptidoglycan/LPS O-acetylase OafA/YrhL
MCWEGDDRLLYTLAAAAVIALAFGAPALLILRARGDRALVAATWLAAIVLGIGAVAIGFGDDENLVVWVTAGAVAGLLIGAGAAIHRHRRPLILTAVGVLGAGAPAVGLTAALIGLVAVTGTCLD